MSEVAIDDDSSSIEKLRRLRSVRDRYLAARRLGNSLRVGDFLEGIPEPEREAVLREFQEVDRIVNRAPSGESTIDRTLDATPDDFAGPDPTASSGSPGVIEEATRLADPNREPAFRVGPADGQIGPGSIFGDYEIIERIGRGGMGVVYQARQRKMKLNRVVALKLIRADRVADPGVETPNELTERFQVETQAAASIKHDHVVPIYDAGERDGRLFYSMLYVDGPSLDRTLRKGPISGRRAAEILEPIARATQAAHDLQIIHRDIKPSNILIDLAGKPYLTDFGLAKFLGEADGLTISQAQLGSPPYMSPEQARDAGRVGTSSDIYSLGATFYGLMTGRPPFQAADPRETMRQVVSELPVPPRRLNQAIPRDLETLCLRCLEKEPHRRFARAGDLADELARFLAGEPILTRPISPGERAVRWARRRPTISGLTAAIILLTTIWILTSIRQSDLARTVLKQKNAELSAKNQLLELRSYRDKIALASLSITAQRLFMAEEQLEDCPGSLRGWEWHYLRRRLHEKSTTWRIPEGGVLGLAVRPDGDEVACGGEGPTITLWNPRTGQPTGSLSGFPQGVSVRRLAWGVAPDQGDQLAAACSDGSVRIWGRSKSGWSPPREIRAHSGSADDLTFSDDGRKLASTGIDGRIEVWNPASGDRIVTLLEPRESGRGLQGIAFGPRGRELAATSDDGLVRLWTDSTDPKSEVVLGKLADCGLTIAFSRDGRSIAAADADRGLGVWDRTGKVNRRFFQGHTDGINALSFMPDGSRIASAGADGSVMVWNPDAGSEGEMLALRDHSSEVEALAFSPDGTRLVSADAGGLVIVRDASPWASPPPTAPVLFKGHQKMIVGLAVRSDGDQVASAATDGEIRLWNPVDPSRSLVLSDHKDRVNGLAYGPGGDSMVSAGREREIRLWRLDDRPSSRIIGGDRKVIIAIACFPDGKRFVTAGASGSIQVGEFAGDRPKLVFGTPGEPVFALAVSPDGRWVASAGAGPKITLWEIEGNSATARPLIGHTRQVNSLAFSHDGRSLISVSHDWTARTWDVESGQPLLVLTGHTGRVWGVAAAPDNRFLATAGSDGMVRVWESKTGREVATLAGHDGRVYAVAFDPAGRFLASAGKDATVRLWDRTRWETLAGPRD